MAESSFLQYDQENRDVRMNIAVFSVIYPGIDDYFSEFLASLSRQSNKNFTLFLINDGLSSVVEFLQQTDLDAKVKDVGWGSPTKLRMIGIQWIMEAGVDAIIFADADDTFAENRVEISANILQEQELVFNELILTGQGFVDFKPMLETHFRDEELVNSSRIRTGNCMGLSNTAIRVESIPSYFDQIPDSITAFDWAFFALCLHAGAKGVFTKRTATYYRQHDNNIANPCSLTEVQIVRWVQIKSEHYRFLSRFYAEYFPLKDYYGKLLDKLQANEIQRREYCEAVRKFAPVMPLWWEPIKTLEALGL